MEFLAHRSEDKREQTLAEHLLGAGALAHQHAEKLGLGPAGELLGLLHDLGKATETIQRYLGKPEEGLEPQDELRGKIDHSTAGAQLLCRELLVRYPNALVPDLANLLSLPIVSHHSGMIDAMATCGTDTLQRRIEKAEPQTRLHEAWRELDPNVRARVEELLADPTLLKGLKRAVDRILPKGSLEGDAQHVQVGLLTRMLFSCLIDADRTDTANFENRTVGHIRQAGQYVPWTVLQERLDAKLGEFRESSVVNAIRRNVSDACFAAAARPQGTYTLTVPTGGGKTLAALRFALQHAQSNGLDRIVFVSPFISIVDQNAAVARRILEPADSPPASIVLEHHSNLSFEGPRRERDRLRERWRHKVLAENWDAPVVFTTMAQPDAAQEGKGITPIMSLSSPEDLGSALALTHPAPPDPALA